MEEDAASEEPEEAAEEDFDDPEDFDEAEVIEPDPEAPPVALASPDAPPAAASAIFEYHGNSLANALKVEILTSEFSNNVV